MILKYCRATRKLTIIFDNLLDVTYFVYAALISWIQVQCVLSTDFHLLTRVPVALLSCAMFRELALRDTFQECSSEKLDHLQVYW